MVLREALALQVQKVQVRLRVVPAQAAGPELLIMDAPTKAGAEKALGAFVAEFEAKCPTRPPGGRTRRSLLCLLCRRITGSTYGRRI